MSVLLFTETYGKPQVAISEYQKLPKAAILSSFVLSAYLPPTIERSFQYTIFSERIFLRLCECNLIILMTEKYLNPNTDAHCEKNKTFQNPILAVLVILN